MPVSKYFPECNFDARNIYLTVTLCGSDAGYFEISDLVLVYGGIGAENEIFDDFWSFNTSNFEWKKVMFLRSWFCPEFAG